MAQQVQIRRGTAAAWTAANPVLASGEMGVETDTQKIKAGDGVTAWASLTYIGTALTVKDEGSALASAATTIDFVGAGVTASGTGATKTVTIPGGGSATLPITGTGATAATDMVNVKVTGDTVDRYVLNSDGSIDTGPGNAAADVTWGRGTQGGGVGLVVSTGKTVGVDSGSNSRRISLGWNLFSGGSSTMGIYAEGVGGCDVYLANEAGSGSTITMRTGGAIRFVIDYNGSIVLASAALATNATNGFTYLPSCAGPPTGTPTTKTGTIPAVVDSTNSKLYAYVGGAWKSVTLT